MVLKCPNSFFSSGISRPRSGSAPPTPVNVLSMPSSTSSTSSSPPYNRQVTAAIFSKTTTKTPTVPQYFFFICHVALLDLFNVLLVPFFQIPSSHWKSFSQLPSFSSLFCSSLRPSPSPLRCNVDSLLHLFGCWLFDAALMSRDSGLSLQYCLRKTHTTRTHSRTLCTLAVLPYLTYWTVFSSWAGWCCCDVKWMGGRSSWGLRDTLQDFQLQEDGRGNSVCLPVQVPVCSPVQSYPPIFEQCNDYGSPFLILQGSTWFWYRVFKCQRRPVPLFWPPFCWTPPLCSAVT